MVFRMGSLVLTLLLLSSFPAESYTESTYHIKPTSDTPCPAEPCLTLSDYAQSHILTSDTTLIFLPGNHSLDRDIAVTNVTRFVMLGDSTSLPKLSAIIVCKGQEVLTFHNISLLHIQFLQISSCGSDMVPAVSVVSVSRLEILDSVFQDNGKASLLVVESLMNCNGTNFSSSFGTGLTSSKSYAEIHSSIFSNNLGGGINSTNSTLTLVGTNTFMSNTAKLGGGVSAIESSIYINGNMAFLNNSARTSGGGVYLERSVLSCNGTMTFNENIISGSDISTSMTGTGGGISALDSEISLEGNSTFIDNVAMDGGGLYLKFSQIDCSGYISFVNNHADGDGGGLLLSSSKGNIESTNSFTSNTANNGGGVAVFNESNLKLSKNSLFEKNVADQYAGGIYIQNSWLSCNVYTRFFSNLAYNSGGALTSNNSIVKLEGSSSFVHNTAYYAGGALMSNNSNVTLEGSSTFVSNAANNTGGAITSAYSNVIVEGGGMFINNSAEVGGGIALAYGTNLTLNGDNSFVKNMAYKGGGIFLQNSSLSICGHISFINNVADDSGGLLSHNSTVRVEGVGMFINNSGGGIAMEYGSDLTLNGDYSFVKNIAYQGGEIFVQDSSVSSSGHISFINNQADNCGGGLVLDNSNVKLEGVGRFANNSAENGGGIAMAYGGGLTLNGDYSFVKNKAYQGGGIFVQDSSVSSSGHISFINNQADDIGGGLVSINSSVQLEGSKSSMMYEVGDGLHNGHVIFVNNSAAWAGGFVCTDGTNISIAVPSTFIRNKAQYGGGGMGIYAGCTMTLSAFSTFTDNNARYGGGAHLIDSTMRFMARTDVQNNSAVYGGGIHGSRAILEIRETVSFTENSATNGGGLSLAKGSQCLLSSNTIVYLSGNHAEQYGGALFVADEPFLYCMFRQQSWIAGSRERCFFQPLDLPEPSVHFILENNTAEEASTALYGGMVDKCDIPKTGLESNHHSGVIFNETFNIIRGKSELVISSEPFGICPCYYDYPNCSQSEVTVTACPGETFSVSLVAVGQRNGIVPSPIKSSFDGNGASIADLQRAQSATNTCTPLQYTVSSTNSSVTMTLLAEGPCLDLGESLNVNIHLKPCPVGFQLSEVSKRCFCEQRLQKYTNSCDIDDLSIGIDGNTWVGLDKTANGTILHSHCPFDYCKTHSVRFTLNETDLQCNYDRTGLLCGGCQPGLSLALGSSHCLQCSNAYLSLLIGFALAGIALVILLLKCKLTVAMGTINGLIFYANIIAVNQSVFFPSGDTNIVLDILRVFISWLNLDLGIETCFYDGMDAYTKTWLQFIFPVYIWVLVCIIIILCYYKTWAVRMFGSNPVAVLATLFLLSYTKLLRIIITALSFAFLDYPDGSEVAVWLYDGNVRYLHGKHIPLFLAAMTILLLVFLPYTVVLSFGQWIQARSRNRLFSWINNYHVKAFLDAYHGPFKAEHRYLHGLLLVVRSCLFLIFAFNVLGNPNINLLAIGVCSIALLALLLLIGGNVYANWYLQVLDISLNFVVNTGVFAAVTLYLRHTGGNQAVLVYASVGIALATFVGIINYHMSIQLKDSHVWRSVIHPKLQRHQRQWIGVTLEDPVADEDPDVPPHPPTRTFIDLRETLLEDSMLDIEDERAVAEPERYIALCHAQPTQTVVNLQQLIYEDPANNVLPMIELH